MYQSTYLLLFLCCGLLWLGSGLGILLASLGLLLVLLLASE